MILINKEFFSNWSQNPNKKKIMTLVLIIAGCFSLVMLIKFLMTNNLAWLEGQWQNQTETIELTTVNHDYTTWDITENEHALLTNGLVTVDSNSKNLFLVNQAQTKKIHVTKLNRHKLKLELIYRKKIFKTVILQKKNTPNHLFSISTH